MEGMFLAGWNEKSVKYPINVNRASGIQNNYSEVKQL